MHKFKKGDVIVSIPSEKRGLSDQGGNGTMRLIEKLEVSIPSEKRGLSDLIVNIPPGLSFVGKRLNPL